MKRLGEVAGRKHRPPPPQEKSLIAFTFPGQGSQKPGAGQAWVGHPSWTVVQAAADASGRDVAGLLLTATAEELRRTDNAQLATYVASLLVLDAVRRLGVDASYVAGHSLGEYTALTAAGVLSPADGAVLVTERGAAMAEATGRHEGTMSAVLGGADDAIEAACAQARAEGHDVWVANYNAPGQLVIAGSPAGLATASEHIKAAGAKRVMPVAVSGAFHTPYMAAAQDRLDAALAKAEWRQPTITPAANVDAQLHPQAGPWQGLLSRQLCSPVRWSQLIGTLRDAGVTTFIEIGPGAVLTGLAKRGAQGAKALSASTPEEVEDVVKQLTSEPTTASLVEGETLYATERMVVSPLAGVFAPHEGLRDGDAIAEGDEIGRVGGQAVHSRFAGRLVGLLAWRGERVATWQPLLWLRVF